MLGWLQHFQIHTLKTKSQFKSQMWTLAEGMDWWPSRLWLVARNRTCRHSRGRRDLWWLQKQKQAQECEEWDETCGGGCDVQQGSQQKSCVPVSPDAFVHSVLERVWEFAPSQMMIFSLSVSYVCTRAFFLSVYVCVCVCVCKDNTVNDIFTTAEPCACLSPILCVSCQTFTSHWISNISRNGNKA